MGTSLTVVTKFLLVFAACIVMSITDVDAQRSKNVAGDFTPVSIAPLGENEYLVADYKHIYKVFVRDGAYALKNIPIIVSAGQAPYAPDMSWTPGAFNPTGVFFHEQKVYIANYNGRNVLVGAFSRDKQFIEVDREVR